MNFSKPVALLATLLLLVFTACSGDDGPQAGQDAHDNADSGGSDDTGTEPDDDNADTADLDNGGEGDSDDADPDLDSSDSEEEPAPQPFERPQVGEPLSDSEITAFTRELTGFWRDSDYFRWVRMTSHGVDESNDQGWFHYALWWQDTDSIREGDTVIFRHQGRADNLTLRTCKVLNNAIAGYLLTGDEDMRWIVENYSRGIAALSMVMDFGDDDETPYLQARTPFTRNHDFETVGGRKVSIDYDPVRRDEHSWNASIIHNPDNPWWGDVHFVNQRSKDDVPHMYRSVPLLRRAAEEAPDESVREAATLALEFLEGFAADIVATGYKIRTKYEDGLPVVPTEDNGVDKDLASLVHWEALIPNAECTAKLTSSLVAGQGLQGFDCGDGLSPVYEQLATTSHYFNYAIVEMFHVAALTNLRQAGHDALADALIPGLAARADARMHNEALPNRNNPDWDAGLASFLLASAASGLPLTHEEAHFVHAQYRRAIDNYAGFEWWDPWAEGLPDGIFSFQPPRNDNIRRSELGYFMEYCLSDLRDPASAPVVDCEIIADPARWGE